MGSGSARQAAPTFIVCAKADSAHARRLIRREGWPLLSGATVGPHAAKLLCVGERGIVVGHGSVDGSTLFLARGPRRVAARRWLWVGMKTPPLGATIYLYSCYCGNSLAPALSGSIAVGHYDVVPIPTPDTERTVQSFFAGIRTLLATMDAPNRPKLVAGARQLAAAIAQAELLQGPTLNFLAAVALERSLTPRKGLRSAP